MRLPSLLLPLLSAAASALSIADINGPAFLSPYAGKTVTNITGLVTAVGPAGFFLRDPAAPRPAFVGSYSIYVFSATAAKSVSAGSLVTIGAANVTEYRSTSSHIYLTELTAPRSITTVSSGHAVRPIILGSSNGLQPPIRTFTALDGAGGVFALPNNASQISTANATLHPSWHGLDFWESLTGAFVILDAPAAVSKSSSYGDVWVRGSWHVSGLNQRGGLTITAGDANPEAIMIGTPLDGTRNAAAKVGDKLAPIKGVVTYAFGTYRILPLTALRVTEPRLPAAAPPSRFRSTRNCSGVTVAQYNVENLAPTSAHLGAVAAQIVDVLHAPDLLFLQEVQDGSGPADDGTVDAGATLRALVDAIVAVGGMRYAYVDLPPRDGEDGGQPGGNIRTAYLYNPSLLSLANTTTPSPTNSTADTAATLLPGPVLTPNPARLAPSNPAWTNSRKPLIAQFHITNSSTPLFAVNIHFASKGGSSPLHGDLRPPVNGGVADRLAQATLVRGFVDELLRLDPGALVAAVGDFNEFAFVAPMETLLGGAKKGVLRSLDEVVKITPPERYTYVFDGNSQQLDHMLVSTALARRVGGFEHVHVSSWAAVGGEVSDHDPSVGVVGVC